MKNFFAAFCIIIMSVIFVACNEDNRFSSSPSLRLEFSTDTVSFDTLFTELVSPSSMFVVRNRNKNALRISDVCLAGGDDSEFSVLVDGQYGSVMNDLEIRANDSLFVVASVKPLKNGADKPLLLKDSLLFTLESGVSQHVLLMAHGRDVTFMHAEQFTSDTLLAPGHYVVYDSLCVAEGAKLSLCGNTTLYFHDNAFMKVAGTLEAKGGYGSPVVFRGDRTDKLFSYLPYDRVPGKWGGIVLASTSNGNVLEHCDIHGGEYGIRVERGDTAIERLSVRSSIIENFTGHALELLSAKANVENSLIANAQGNCVKVAGGNVSFVHCTIANFYVWKQREAALALHNSIEGEPAPLYGAKFLNCIITGTKEDEVMGSFTQFGDTVPFIANYLFENSLINTIDTQDSCFVNIVYDSVGVAPFAKEHFRLIDHDVFDYDFHLTEESRAKGIASDKWLDILPYDLDGTLREAGSIDAGCFQFVEEAEEDAAGQ
ncbi:MAG: hypothetical protein IJY44_03840 [Bacteroidaceae bacterium]|nr:hypothetical protein [Bacteroidaceae bacterium]